MNEGQSGMRLNIVALQLLEADNPSERVVDYNPNYQRYLSQVLEFVPCYL